MCGHGSFPDDSTRRAWYNPELVLKNVGLQSGMVFADIGCGSGFFALLAAKVVGRSGLVYAVDLSAAAIEKLKRKASKQGLENIRAEVGRGEETRFCGECVDIVFYSMVLHDFDDPAKVLLNAKYMLKPHGKLVDLDWKKKPMNMGPPDHIRFSEDTASCLLRNAGFTIESVRDAGSYHYLVTAYVASPRL